MTLQSILEQDKERFLRSLGQARTPAEAAGAVRDECGRLLAAYNEEAASDAERETIYQMITAVSAASALVDSTGEPKVYVRDMEGRLLTDRAGSALAVPEGSGTVFSSVGKRGAAEKVKGFAAKFTSPVLLALGAGLLAAVPLSGVVTGQAGGSMSILGTLGLTVLGGVSMWLSGRMSAVRKAAGVSLDIQTQTEMDSEKIYRNLLTMTMVMDKTLAEAAGRRKAVPAGPAAESAKQAMTRETEVIGLISGILETASSLEDREAADDLTSQLKYYLHGRGIEAVQYTPESAYAFELIPAQEEETLRPALIRDGKVLEKGLATRRSS